MTVNSWYRFLQGEEIKVLVSLSRWLRSTLGNRRKSKRYLAPGNLEVVARLTVQDQPGSAIIGYARNLSVGGIMFETDECRISDLDLSVPGARLSAVMTLPATVIAMKLSSLRCAPLEGQETKNHLVVIIMEMGERDEAHYQEFLKTLG